MQYDEKSWENRVVFEDASMVWMNSANTCSAGWVFTMFREPGTLHKLQLAQNVAARFFMKRR